MADQADAPAAAKAPDRSGKPGVAPFLAWLAVFYIAWAACVSLVGGWGRLLDYWPIAKAMAIGSYFAGSTPMGGGTVGFPVLTLMFDYPASLGRNFALAVQSAGMVSASLFILVRRRSLDLALLRPALAGAAVGTPLGALLIAPIVPDLAVRLIFAVIWAAFGIIHWLKIGEIVTPNGPRTPHDRLDVPIGLAVGFSGGVVASVTGVGADMMLYAALVLFYRTDLKVAIPTSVILMAFTSVIGLAANCGLSAMIGGDYQIDPEVFWNWLAAAPVVVLGAPLGAIIVARLPREPTLLIVSTLCVVQFVWTLVDQRVAGLALAASLTALGGLCWLFLLMHRAGHKA
jgi:uncharacterized membrane protein YfcA